MLVFTTAYNKAFPSHPPIQSTLFDFNSGLCCSYSHRPNELESHLQHFFKANCKVKYSQTLNYLPEIIFFPSVFIIKLFLHLLEPLYKTCLQFKSTSKYSLVQYFWSLASKVFFPLLWLHAFYCITASCLTLLQQINLW